MTEKDYNNCVTLYADNVFRFIIKNLKHEENARDIIQSAFEKLWENHHKVEYEKAKSYLFKIAYHQMIDFIRKNKRIIQSDLNSTDIQIIYPTNNDVKKILMEALERLNEEQKCLIMLKDYEGYSYQEIGEIMNMSETKIKVYLHRARLILRDYLVSKENVL
jgi:RNA polymerase sigma factor (sigma-70 family)